MCGIFGIISAFNTKALTFALPRGSDILTDGMVITSLRGQDSTGVFQIQDTLKPYMYKKAMPAALFVDDATAQTYAASMARSMLTVVHCRAATHGSISDRNAHPFEVPYTDKNGVEQLLLGVHNGSLHGWQSAAGADKFQVDSAFALAQIAKRGPDFLKDGIPDGAYSFVWWNSAAPTMAHFARNTERPMWMLRSKDKHHIVFASEPLMTSAVLDRRGQLGEFEDTVFSTNPHTHYVVDTQRKELEIQEVSHWEAPKSYRTYSSTFHMGASDWEKKDTEKFFLKMDAVFDAYDDAMGVDRASGEKMASDEEQPSLLDDVEKAIDKFMASASNDFITTSYGFPHEFGEIGAAPDSELYTDDVSDAQQEDADSRGLFGEVVVFTSTGGMADDRSVAGTIQVLSDHGDWSEPHPMRARMLWPTSRSTTFAPPTTKGAHRFAAIVGLDNFDDGTEGYVLSPLGAGAVLMLGQAAMEWNKAHCPDLRIAM